jgi:uncharacterized membrane protein
MKHEARSRPVPDLLLLLLALAGFAINVLLFLQRYSDAAAGIAGCGGAACEEVLASRWSVIMGLPVTVFGMLAYAGAMLSLTNKFRRMRGPLLAMIAGASVWFVFVQAVLLGKFCPWCMAAHGVGFAAWAVGRVRPRAMAVWGAAALLGIGLIQVYGPVPATHRIDDLLSHSRGDGRKAIFDGGRKSYEVSAMPRLGPADAKHVLVEYFDYQCAACRTMAGFLEAFAAKHPSDVALLVLPVPFDGACNPHVSAANQHSGSCEIARIALAVWRVNPGAFPAYHKSLIAGASVASARSLALEVMPPERLAAALADPWIDELLRSNIAGWRGLSQTTDKLPKLLIRDKRILHGLPSGEADFIRVMEKELGL